MMRVCRICGVLPHTRLDAGSEYAYIRDGKMWGKGTRTERGRTLSAERRMRRLDDGERESSALLFLSRNMHAQLSNDVQDESTRHGAASEHVIATLERSARSNIRTMRKTLDERRSLHGDRTQPLPHTHEPAHSCTWGTIAAGALGRKRWRATYGPWILCLSLSSLSLSHSLLPTVHMIRSTTVDRMYWTPNL